MSDEEPTSLEEQRDALLKSLRDLEAERAAGDVTESDYIALKNGYTARAAAVLRAIETSRAAAGSRRTRPRPAGTRPRPAGTRPRPAGARPAPARVGRRQKSVAITVAVAFSIVTVAVVSVMLFAAGRDPGEPVTGSVPPVSTVTDDRLDQALQLETEGKAVEALKLYDEILQDDPDNVEVLSYRGWLLKRAGLPDRALESLDAAVAADPTYPDAHFFRGMVLYQDKDDPAGAVVEFEAFLANDPPADFVGGVQEVLAKAKEAAAAKAAGLAPPDTSAPADPLPTG